MANSIPDEDLSGLLDNVDSFIDWWKIRLRAFTEICCLANYLKPGMGGLGVLSMQKISGGIRDDYKQYKDQVRLRVTPAFPSNLTVFIIGRSTTVQLCSGSSNRFR